MNITQLRYFATVAQMQNLSKAAEALHLSQPALSRSIARLEEELGTPLFLRQGKRITLNPQGERFLESAWSILRDLDSAMAELKETSTGTAARVSVGLCQPDEKITRCLAAFLETHPEVELTLTCSIETQEPPDINQYDMLLYPDQSRYRKFRGIPLWEEAYLLALPAAHPLAGKAAVTPAALEGLPFVFFCPEPSVPAEPYYLCTGLNLHLHALAFTDDRELHRQFIASGMALGFVTEGCAGPYRQDPRLRLVPMASDKFRRQLMLCFKREKHLSPAGKVFQSFVLDHLDLTTPANPLSRRNPHADC